MPLQSASLSGDERHEACLVKDSAHLTPDVRGEFVAKVQAALIYLDKLRIDEHELETQTYGPSTAAAVLAFKKKRKIINFSYQKSEDNIVGKMTNQGQHYEAAALMREAAERAAEKIFIRELRAAGLTEEELRKRSRSEPRSPWKADGARKERAFPSECDLREVPSPTFATGCEIC